MLLGRKDEYGIITTFPTIKFDLFIILSDNYEFIYDDLELENCSHITGVSRSEKEEKRLKKKNIKFISNSILFASITFPKQNYTYCIKFNTKKMID